MDGQRGRGSGRGHRHSSQRGLRDAVLDQAGRPYDPPHVCTVASSGCDSTMAASAAIGRLVLRYEASSAESSREVLGVHLRLHP